MGNQKGQVFLQTRSIWVKNNMLGIGLSVHKYLWETAPQQQGQ